MSDMNLNSHEDAGSPATPSWNEALSATMREAIAESSEGADGGDQAAEQAEVIEEADAGDEPAGASDDDSGDSPAGGQDTEAKEPDKAIAWDGKPDTMPPEFKAHLESAVTEAVKKRESEMSRGVNKLLQERAEMQAQLQAMYAQIQQNQVAPQQQQAGPPKPPAGDADPADWDRYYSEQTAWTTKQTIAEMVKSGQLLTPEMVQPIQQQVSQAAAQAEQIGRLQYIARLPGCSDEIMQRMAEIAKEDENLYGLLSTDKGSETVFKLAKAQLEAEQKLAGVGAKAESDARRGASAAGNAVGRPGGVRKEGAPAGRPKESFRSVEERIAYEIAQARRA